MLYFLIMLHRNNSAAARACHPRIRAGGTHQRAPATRHEGQPFEQVNILLVLEKRTVQLRQHVLRVAAQVFGCQISSATSSLSQSSTSEVEGFFFKPRHLAQFVELRQRGAHQLLLDARIMDLDDLLQGLRFGKLDVVEEAASQERVGQFLLVVRGDDDDGPLPGLDVSPVS